MSFLTSYKRLDNLCKDMFQSEKGVVTYLENMQAIRYNIPHRADFDADYNKLNQYRRIRNQIAHDNYADESNMCSEEDAAWLEQFYERILTQTDPIVQYHKTLAAPRQQPAKPKKAEQLVERRKAYKPSSNKPLIALTAFLIVFAIVLIWFAFAVILK